MKITSLIIFLGFVTVAESFLSTPFLTTHSTVAKEGTSASPTNRTAKKDDKIVETVRKPEFISKIAEKSGLTKADSEAALSAILETISEEVAAGKKISMVGFGTFKLTERAARLGRNPKTGEEIQIKASKSPKFTAGKAFKEQCNS
eukprot:CAMPEP_0198262570 /NCGR_PEP_ID=MMETSP1447-20131203/11053_1 /TAXON_ID=420782 /ORGANISM="Chaetoceros dichaeta, Strain CCMP1751" /LENGTH=145 /DNA_ID=CAMNT_0043950857 /DNA_START=73 /DNA_END=510 /DNA_ORIENTATION=+